ncbi:AAA family ATPase, partial [bacterium]|nr:AAA family ATPase [bacterium]
LQAKLTGTSIGSSPGNSDPIPDKYLRYQSDDSSIDDSDSESDDLSSIEDDGDNTIFDYESDLSELETDDADVKREKQEIKKIVQHAIRSKMEEESDESEEEDEEEQDDGDGNVINLILGVQEGEEEAEEENYLDTLTPEEKQELLSLENQISKIIHKRVPLRYQILRSHLPIDIKAIAIRKLETIQKMEESSNEFHKMSNWIDGLLSIPFNKFVDTNITFESSKPEEITSYLTNVKEKLDASVYGHVEAKSTLLEIVASWISNPTAIPTVIGLQGPPGTGKTTLIKDGVAKALGRPFSMFALGGATDASYLEGHSYTYEGSMWGRLAGILMECKCMNPVIFMDELDKVSETKHGEEIIGVLTHLIDYSQNNVIQDKYFAGVPLDFSKALFIFSFNDESRLNPILKDRIHIIRTDECKKEAKLVIAKDYLLPKILANVKFSKEEIIFTDETILNMIERYTENESGVRNLKRSIESVIMKLNTLRLTSQNPALGSSPNSQLIPYYLNNYKLPMTITTSIVEKLIGKTSLGNRDNGKHLSMYM